MKNIFSILLICILLLVSMLLLMGMAKDTSSEHETNVDDASIFRSDNEEKDNMATPIIPEQSEIAQNGYPTNKYGETYGPDVKELDLVPDLLLVQNESGVLGYIRVSELEGISPESPSDAEKYESVTKLNMYLEDGRTIVGEFYLSTEIMEEFFYE